MLRKTLSAEGGQQRRVNTLVFGPLLNRARPHGDPTWLSSDHVGSFTRALATLPTVTGQDFQVPTLTDYDMPMNSAGGEGENASWMSSRRFHRMRSRFMPWHQAIVRSTTRLMVPSPVP
ncbi:hypothetical protein NCC78_19465 [Micromonospora phytophila]|uniref:hypothetical protein n=1 Tax=Micromonospora phytophila TaxID=709888 RepID=UPI00202F1D99|nr:hypothetical protein [Micromonospora phytophila]MCM0676847.1 hypothetical protein [Micromonospora phytophila]